MIPPSKPPSTTLYGPATLRGYGDDRNTSSREEKPAPKEEGVVNRGWNFLGEFKQSCILLTSLSVISSKFPQKFAQKCQYFTLIDQSVPPDNCYVTCLLREESALNYSTASRIREDSK